MFNLSPGSKHLVNNIGWAATGKCVSLIGSLFVGIVVARYLGPDQYGLMNYVVSYVAIFQIISLFGLDNIEIREESKGKESFRKIIGTALTLKIIFALITIIAIIVSSYILEADIETFGYVAIYSLSVIANTFIVYRNYFTAIVENERIAKSEILRTGVGMAIKIVLLLLKAPLIWFIITMTLDAYIIATGYFFSYARKTKNPFPLVFDKEYALYLMKESFPILMTSVAVIVYQRIDQVMIKQMIDNESVGYFSVAVRIVEILIFAPQIAIQTVMPILIRYKEENQKKYIEKMQLFMGVTIWITFGIAVVTSLVSPLCITLLFGDSYAAAIPILQTLAFKAPCAALSSIAGQMLIIDGLQKYAIFRDCMGCAVCIGLNLLLIPLYGVEVVAVVAILSSLVSGYFSDIIIPPYRHIFKIQTKAVLLGWTDILHINKHIHA